MKSNERLDEYSKQIDVDSGNASKIWNILRKDFQLNKSNLRGYGLSTIPLNKIRLYRTFYRYLSFPFKGTLHVTTKAISLLERVLSWAILAGDKNAAVKFGFSDYKAEIYPESDLKEFLDKYWKHNIGFSHNTFKSYSYLKRLNNSVNIGNEVSIFEIGAGVFNFGHLLSFQLSKFEYVVCDLPEMIAMAFNEINNKYLPLCDGNYEVFLPTEIKEFERSNNYRKVLFITPDQLNDGVLGSQKRFDLFINHESFAEMDIDVVNSYLNHLPSLMKVGAAVNIVNRHTRPQCKSYEDFRGLKLENITCFDDYRLDFCEVVLKESDTFRAAIHSQQSLPNVYYVGKVCS